MESQNTGHADFDLWGQLALNFWAQTINPPQPPTTRFNYRQVPHLVALSLKILNAHESVFTTDLYIRPQPLSQLLVALSGTRYCFNSWKYDLSEYHWSLHFFVPGQCITNKHTVVAFLSFCCSMHSKGSFLGIGWPAYMFELAEKLTYYKNLGFNSRIQISDEPQKSF